ncbi:putative short-chain dehydrogenase [Hypoxylon crocopeplum]|nr:putative short-chain dehydrogenase [Hypoxylon crocopeplum]
MPEFNVDTTVNEVVKALGTHALGKTFVITGPSAGGIGATAAISLASANPTRLILAGRSQSKAQPVIGDIAKISNGAIVTTFVELDLTNLSSVREAAAKIRQAAPDGIDGLFNNAGIMAPREYKKSVDGVELQFAANHLGHFLLTNLLLPDIAKVNGIVSNATSRAWTLVDPDYDDVNFQDGEKYHGWIAYSRSKTANITFSIALAKRVEELGITVFAVDPGMALDSNLTKNSGIDNDWFGEGFRIATERANGKAPEQPIINLQQAAATAVLTFLDPALKKSTGSYLEECQIRDGKLPEYVKSSENAEKLWEVSEQLVGEKFSP